MKYIDNYDEIEEGKELCEIEHIKHFEPAPLYNARGDQVGVAPIDTETLVTVLNGMIDVINSLIDTTEAIIDSMDEMCEDFEDVEE